MQKCFELILVTTLDDHESIFKAKMLWWFLDYWSARCCNKNNQQTTDLLSQTNKHGRKTENIVAGIESGHGFLFYVQQKVSRKLR